MPFFPEPVFGYFAFEDVIVNGSENVPLGIDAFNFCLVAAAQIAESLPATCDFGRN